MKLSKTAKAEMCVSHDKQRPILHDAWLDVENKVLVSVDGRCMSILPVEISEGDTSGRVTKEALVAARKVAVGNTIEIECNGARY